MTSTVRADLIRACNPGMRYQDAPAWSWPKLARGTYDSAINRTLYSLDLQHAVDWRSKLKVLQPGQ